MTREVKDLSLDTLSVLDLFSGIGAYSLGLERTGGFKTVAFCEIDPFCRRVLAKHWPDVPCYDDIRTLTADTLARDGVGIDVICGGFPCQDISRAGLGAGIKAARSGLWSEYVRLIGELRPRFIIVENVAALLDDGLGVVLGDLAAGGYDAEWDCIPAATLGAPHERDRVWLVAYADTVNGPTRLGIQPHDQAALWTAQDQDRASIWLEAPPHPPRVGDGVSCWVDRRERTEAVGNAVVPQIPELLGRAILSTLNPERIR